MSIANRADYQDSMKQRVEFSKPSVSPGVSAIYPSWCSFFDGAGEPAAGTLAGTSAAAGVVPDDSVAGYPQIFNFLSGASGHLTAVIDYQNIITTSQGPLRLRLYDRLFVAGAYAFNANTTLASQPSYSGRVPFKSDGSTPDYSGLEIWAETVTAATGSQTWLVQYTNQDGTTGNQTGATAQGGAGVAQGVGHAPGIRECFQLPLCSGDSGVQKIEIVTGGTASAGTANIMVLRPLWSSGYVDLQRRAVSDGIFKLNMPKVFQDSALYLLGTYPATAGSSGAVKISFEIANK